jgi:hypothetical protein
MSAEWGHNGRAGLRSVSLVLRTVSAGLLGLLTACTFAAKHERPDSPPPTARIEVEPLGYHPLSSFYLLARSSSSSLDYIDEDHLLFTFRVAGLMQRLPDCPKDDSDQIIRAVVLHLPDGKVERSAEWRMHDRGRYLWPLRDGRFLIRQRDSLLTTDASLKLEPYIESNSPIRLVKPSPDGRLLLVETDLEEHTEAEHRKLMEQALFGPGAIPEDVQLTILRVEDRSLVAHARALTPTDLVMIESGYLETLAGKKDHWLVRYQPFHGDPSVVADIASSCRPTESSLTEKLAFVSTCLNGGDRLVQTTTIDGKKLWTYRWDSHYIWPTIAASEDGSRIAFSTLRVPRPVAVDAFDPVEEDEIQEQRIEVLDAESGKVLFTQFAEPIVSAGQNYALSPDGRGFALVRKGAIELYDLPPLSPAVRTEGK